MKYRRKLRGIYGNQESPPARGAWIEIMDVWSYFAPIDVAPREGGVD